MKIFTTLLICISINALSQEGIAFEIEKLSRPDEALFIQSVDNIYKQLILSDVDMSLLRIRTDSIDFPFNILAKSDDPDSLVNFSYNSFFYGMYQAYADHRPFILSPDMIWLLISQGFARHVNANSEKLRDHFVDFSGKLPLVVQSAEISLENPESPWEKIFPAFTEQIAEHTGQELMEILSSDFSTTTPVEKIASEITIMEAMEPYFEFIVIYAVCGIPEITLKGSTEDWERLSEKTKKLGEYDLKWWTGTLEPILKEFVNASKGEINKKFWRNMFKYHSQKKYGAPNIIDGWIVSFFPYDKDGKRNNLRMLEGGNNLPEEIVKVDLKYIEMIGDASITTPLELWAGFIGLEQNNESFALTPKIGWMIRKKDTDKIGLNQKLASDIKSMDGIAIRVKEIPEAIFALNKINNLEISFIDEILIPDKMGEMGIKRLELSGKIDSYEIDRIRKMFPNCELIINSEIIKVR